MTNYITTSTIPPATVLRYYEVWRKGGSAPSVPTTDASASVLIEKVSVTYGLKLKDGGWGGWLDPVTNFGAGDDDFAGLPNC